MNDIKKLSKKIAYVFYALTVWFIGVGFYKMFVYKSYDNALLAESNINSYVGGDAYNYIINSNYAAGYFTLALIFTILGSVVLVLDKLDNLKNMNVY